MTTELKLLDNWKQVLKKAWSVRFAIMAAIFSGLEAFFLGMQDGLFGLPHGTMIAISAIFSATSIYARVLDQPKSMVAPAPSGS